MSEPIGIVTEVFDEWINVHPQNCKEWQKSFSIWIDKKDGIPPIFTFYIEHEGNDVDIKATYCPYCGAELIHWIERQKRAKVMRL